MSMLSDQGAIGSRMGDLAGSGARALALAVTGLMVVGMAVMLGLFIEAQRHAGGPPEEVPRSIAIPALYATAGIIAVIAAIQQRPLIVMATAATCFVGSVLSVATLVFVVPAIVLLALAARSIPAATPGPRDGVVAVAVGVMVVGAGVALLATTGGRCWQETGTLAAPVYTVTACDEGAGSSSGSLGPVGGADGGEIIGSGYDSGVLTITGAVAETLLLAGALALVVMTGPRAPGSPIRGQPSTVDHVDPNEQPARH